MALIPWEYFALEPTVVSAALPPVLSCPCGHGPASAPLAPWLSAAGAGGPRAAWTGVLLSWAARRFVAFSAGTWERLV